jgi:hypothetical protein
LDIRLEFINLGGGIGIPYRPEQKPVDLEALSAGVKDLYDELIKPAGLDPLKIYMENGRCITGPYGYLVTQAIHEKHIYKNYVGVDACMANLMRPGMYGAYHHITVLGKEDAPATETLDVVGSLCENNDKFAIDRVIEQFPADEQSQIRSSLSDVLRGVVAQTLVRKPEGGRMAVLEILVVTPAVANLVREHKTQQLPGVMQTSRGIGMALLNDELQRLVEAKTLPMDTALTTAVDKEDFKRRFRSGVTLAAAPGDPTRFRVMAVVPDSPGARCGLRRGDMVVEANKQDGDQFTLDDLRSLFRTDGKHALVVERSGKRERITLELTR